MVNLNRTVADVIDTNIPHWAALTAVTTDAENGAYAPGVTTGTLTVTLHEDENVRSWLTQEGATDPNDKLEGAYAEYACSTVLGASMDGGKTIIPLYIAPDGGQMVGKLEFPVSTEDDVTHVVEFFELQDGNPITSGEGEDAKPLPFFGIYTSFVAQQAVILGEGDVTFTTPADWPEDGQRVFGDQLTAPFTLSFTVVDQSATWKDTSKVTIRDSEGKLVNEDAHFLWESSNPQVATINEKGEITILTNGAVSFTLTALNGNVEKTPADPPQEATTYAYTYATPEILVGVGNSPFLTVSESLRTTTVRGGQPATVLWSSNLTEKNRDNATGVEDLDSVETIFTLTLYKAGDFDESAGGPIEGAQGVALDPVVSSMKDVKSSALIPASMIPYANGKPYYVTISATDNATGKPYTSWAKIEVQSPPAVVELARPSSLYITDEVGTLPLTWSLANFNGDGKEFRLVITNNTTGAVQGTGVNAENQSGSFTMNIADVTNGYRDTYTVEVAAKNATDSTWSYDSFVLYVYDRVALQQFVVDGEDTANGSTITLSNGEKEYIQGLIDSQNSTAAQQAVWDTGRDISLTADVSMDPDKPWLEVPDQFAWSAEDTTTASGTGQTHATLNYQQGALYEDITRYQRTSYGPTAEFRLSGLSDGTTKVRAEHVNTGTVAELIVNVDTLQDKLFLFQFTPAVETTLRYTNGDGVQKEVTSKADGRAAIYEESGIQGDVYLESQQGDTEYFGTLYNENLVSSEKDSTQLEDTKASYVQWNGASFGEEDIHAFPDPVDTDAGEREGASAQANQESIQGGDNQLRLAGTNRAAIAAWTRVTETLAKEPGSAVTEDEQLLMMNSSEILASVWDGTQWVTTRLTQNSSADMAPVVAVGGGKALVAWRAVAASDSGTPTEFDSYDTIQYKVYDFNTKKWSGPYTLYNGTSGAVKGMEAQMTESGAMAVAYTIEKGSTSSTTRAVTLEDGTTEITSNLQTVFALIQPDATEGYKVAKNVQVTDDKDVNENPQLTAVKFDGEAEESFILGWHSVHSADGEENNDIRLMAFTEDGTLRGDLVDSISAISSQTGSSITSNFRFAKGADTLSELSILWSQPTMDVDEESTTPENNLGTADSDVLMGVRFRVDNGTIGLTAPIQLAALEEQETTSKTIEAFDGWVQSDGSLKAVVLSTEYGVVDPDTELTYHIELVPGVDNEGNSTGELTAVAIQNSQTNLVSVTGSYTDAIAAEVPVPDYQALAVGASVPVQTTVTNLGTQPIISIDFQVGSESQQTPVTIQPGESATVTTNYTVVETAAGNGVLANPDYTVTATFGSGTTARAAASTGTINLNVPNLGVSTFETVQQEDGKRVLRFSLYNNSAAQLENSGRTVKVGLFSDPECTMPIESQYASFSPVSTGTRANGAEFTINSTTDLAAIDQGAYAGQITMDLAAYAKSDPENYMENGEIRSGGVTVDVTFIPEDWPFVDVTEDKWYYDAVAYVYQQGIMVGMSETTFEPNTTVNRAQVVQMLYNLEGQPQVSGDSGFSDIRDGQWYAKAVAWASANDVVAGYEDGTFRPTRAVTREEFAQILYNYAKFKGYDLSASADLGKFPDSCQVSSWAETALGWANGNGLINGHDDGRLDPKCSTIRAQAASILMNFDKGFAQEG